MTRYVAFLRGVSPMNCKMPELKRCFEAAGFTDVKTLLSSGNVAFTAKPVIVPVLEKKIEEAMAVHLDRVFQTIVRPSLFLQSLIDADPFADASLPDQAKRIVTFLRRPCERPVELPIERGEARILKLQGTEVFSAYVPNEKGPVFMALLERTFGAEVTTRTLDTVRKCARA
ncbi:DUF1697 domain-containing protein [Aquabacterium sp.]|uniref:DUF1697 domain-containing protein n=1 Tax=Aquabacterium sp. TaxID=1872578 RepID=UPI003D6D234F